MKINVEFEKVCKSYLGLKIHYSRKHPIGDKSDVDVEKNEKDEGTNEVTEKKKVFMHSFVGTYNTNMF